MDPDKPNNGVRLRSASHLCLVEKPKTSIANRSSDVSD